MKLRTIVFHALTLTGMGITAVYYDPIVQGARALELLPKRNVEEMVDDAVAFVNHPRVTSEIVLALIATESSNNPRANAYNPKERPGKGTEMDQVALASAHGLMQVLGKTARGYGYHWSELYDEWTNILVGTQYLASCYDKYPKDRDAIRCFHAGPNQKQWGPKTNNHFEKFTMHLGSNALERRRF